MIFQIHHIKDDFLEKIYADSMKDLNDFYEINWVHHLPTITIVDNHETINALKGEKTENWVVGWTNGSQIYVLNKDNVWSRCWNINRNLPPERMHPENYPDTQPVFRAILKKKFEEVRGFGAIGYIDDHTLSDKLGVQAVVAPVAVFYHRNPDNLPEIYRQARWIGKSEFKRRKIKDENLMRLATIVLYSLPMSLLQGFYKSVSFMLPQFLIFKLVYDLGVEVSLIKSFFGEQKYR